jgi:tRNA-specific 2-thiouridylase
MRKETIAVGLSGGADSAATARMLMEQGYRVHGIFLSFCEGASSEQAEKVASELRIPLSVVDRRKEFRKKIILPFLATYRKGKTPNPCVECNRKMKIACLLEEADRLGIHRVATGHYAKTEKLPSGRIALLQGEDDAKDQSYFLWKLSQKQLARLVFPLAKEKKKQITERIGDVVEKTQKESMEICFVPHKKLGEYLSENRRREEEPGDFVDQKGAVLGTHKGISHYTVGQRKGLGVAMGKRYFVTKICPQTNCIILGPEEELYTDRFFVTALHWVSYTPKSMPQEGLMFRGRHRGTRIPCQVELLGNTARIRLSASIRRIAPGQSACIYYGNQVVFGAYISEESEK